MRKITIFAVAGICAFMCAVCSAQEGKKSGETKDRLKARLLENVVKADNGDISITPPPDAGNYFDAASPNLFSKPLEKFVLYVYPDFDVERYNKLNAKLGGEVTKRFTALEKYAGYKRARFEKLSFKPALFEKSIKDGMPVFCALRRIDSLFEMFDARQKERDGFKDAEEWADALKKSDKQNASDIAKTKKEFTGAIILGCNPSTKEFQVQLAEVFNWKIVWMSSAELEAALEDNYGWIYTFKL